jgi:hypothetical protein
VQIELASEALQPTFALVTVHDPGSPLSAALHVPLRDAHTAVQVCAIAPAWTKRQVVAVSPQAK